MTADLLRPLLPRYGLPEDAPLRLLNLSENATFMAGADALVIRLHRPCYHHRAEIESELAWLRALDGAPGLRCVQPVADREGRLVQDAGGRHAVAFAPIAGQELQATDALEPWFGPLGAITARLHDHARGWRRPAGFVRKRWDVDTILGARPHWGDWRAAQGLDAEGALLLGQATDRLAGRLRRFGTGPETFGLIHADLRLANLMVDDRGLWAIDFDDCGFGWWLYDLAAALSFIETDPRLPGLIAAWCTGYGSVAPLPAGQRRMIPDLILLRRVLLTAWLASRAESDTAQSLGGPGYTLGTLAMAEAYLRNGLCDLTA
jgi:Ser/Thr protein kinase RdoA (MazF antagonist)